MGELDDAIREHLELKRRQGASEEELKREEDEAFGPAKFGSMEAERDFTPEPPAPQAPLSEPTPEPESGEPEPFESVADAGPSLEPPLPTPEDVELVEERSLAETEIEPDEVLPEEALEPERENGALAEDLLEETPDFLDQETPEQERLWFERKPPKDFDFDS